jgi:hypothetical protein
MMSLLVQLFSNEESANILPVPWFALHRCRFHGIGRLATFRRKISDFWIVADEVRKARPAALAAGVF